MSVVVQARYTQSEREPGEPDLNASASGKSEEMSENRKRSSKAVILKLGVATPNGFAKNFLGVAK